LELKRMPELLPEMVKRGFSKKDLIVINTKETLGKILSKENYSNSNLLLMSSGNYDGLDILEIVNN
jgi:UDP-N-acetylmuramate: L-alanyl-gamma-D-glutamyl-meso-diaminopimelate ligase